MPTLKKIRAHLYRDLGASQSECQPLEKTSNFKFTFKTNTIMGKVSKETRREQRYNANLHNLFVKAQEEIANEQYGRNLCASNKKNTGTLFRT